MRAGFPWDNSIRAYLRLFAGAFVEMIRQTWSDWRQRRREIRELDALRAEYEKARLRGDVQAASRWFEVYYKRVRWFAERGRK
jgi:hypothetical protein